MARSRKRARGICLEVARRMHLQEHGNLKGFGKTARFYRDDWRITYPGGYKAAQEQPAFQRLMECLGM